MSTPTLLRTRLSSLSSRAHAPIGASRAALVPVAFVRSYARQPSEFFTSHHHHSATPHHPPSQPEPTNSNNTRRLLAQDPLEEHGDDGDLRRGQGTGGGPGKPENEEEISDREWDLRVGNAIHHLRTTLPTFFETGLLVHPLPFIDPPSSSSSLSSSSSSSSVPGLPNTGKPVYSPSIRLSYTPPFPLPAPFPRTLHLEGLALYTASASIVRATMSAFHSDLSVNLRRMYVLSHGRRERAARILLNVSGFGRVTGQRSEWDVNCTYTFSPTTGLVSHHRIESIDPAPHISVYDGFRTSLMRVLRGGEGEPAPKRALEPTRTCRDGCKDGGRGEQE